MSKLKVSAKVKFQEYKGFVINVEPVDESFTEFAGVAKNPEQTVKLCATGKTRNECGRQLEQYVDMYRKSDKQKLIIS